jgi:hypothetical protein
MATKTENGAGSEDSQPPSFYDDEENLKKLCDFLRSSEGPPVREALLMEKRVHYLKGTEGRADIEIESLCFWKLTSLIFFFRREAYQLPY